MKIKIYQINLDRDNDGVAFESYDRLITLQKSGRINNSIYDRVYEGFVKCEGLEDIYRMFNIDKPDDYNGRSMSVSDIVEVIESDDVEQGFYYCDSIGFKNIDFDTHSIQESKEPTIKVIIVDAGKQARVDEIGAGLSSMQKVVDGYIETYYPFNDDVCLVCNDEGKLNGSKPNRAIFDDDGELVDIIVGTFFICGCGNERFESLTDEQIDKYYKMFQYPERFAKVNGEIKVTKIHG